MLTTREAQNLTTKSVLKKQKKLQKRKEKNLKWSWRDTIQSALIQLHIRIFAARGNYGMSYVSHVRPLVQKSLEHNGFIVYNNCCGSSNIDWN